MRYRLPAVSVKPRGRALSAIVALAIGISSHSAAASAAEPVDYARQVKPTLKQRCYACHGALKHKAGLRLDTAEAIRRGGDGGSAIEPGRADESLLIERVTDPDPQRRMPPLGPALTDEQVTALRLWIDQGAVTTAPEQPEVSPREHWAFRPPVRPAVPSASDAARNRNPIDAFLARERERRGIAPLARAEPHVLLRRLYLDLVGLPPTRDELHAFLADPSEEHYTRIVEDLLASPRHGERWARHWMDVWRYSDWYGRRAVPDVLNSYAQIWRWRDWIVRSLNEDKGYDRMVQAMLAADEIAPTDEADLVATGFLVRNWFRWNYNSWMKDNVEHVGKAFLGLTINCAHCHDHKYDPIAQEDYFAFRAFFEPLELRHDRVPGEPDPGPFPKYVYGSAYPPITSGMVRVFDAKLDAPTFFYTRGEARNVVPGRPPIAPGVPAFLRGASFRIEPVELPAEASYPGLKAFIIDEELAPRTAALARAEQAREQTRALAAAAQRSQSLAQAAWTSGLPRAFADSPLNAFADDSPSPELVHARSRAEAARLRFLVDQAEAAFAASDLKYLRDRIAADQARYGTGAGDLVATRRAAARAERQVAVDRANIDLVRADRALTVAREKARADDKAKPDVAKAEQRYAAAESALEAARMALNVDSTDYSGLSPTYPRRSTGRRAALARWLTDGANPLTARVAANHLWRWHFGRPLVETTSDFGRNGKPPTHPELLDWLAAELATPSSIQTRPWSMKAMHRLIVTSAAYRMSSHGTDPAHPGWDRDPENRLLWHFPRSRMEAETVRDSLLHLAGELDASIGGPDIDLSQGLTSRRRSLYFTHHGEARMPFLELFDAADACDAYRRATSVVPQQALALVNNEMVLDLSRRLAARLEEERKDRDGEPTDRVREFIIAAFEQILARSPSVQELELAAAFLDRQAALFAREPLEANALARRDLVHALWNHHDFITIH